MVKYLLLLPLIYLCITKYLHQDKIEHKIAGLKSSSIHVEKTQKIFSGTLTRSGSKKNNLTPLQAEAVFYNNIPVESFQKKDVIILPRREYAKQNNSLSGIFIVGIGDLIGGKLPRNKESFLLMLLFVFCSYKALSFILSLISSPQRLNG